MGKNLNISIVLHNTNFIQLNNLVNALNSNNCINQVFLIDNSVAINNNFKQCNANYLFAGDNLGYGAGHNLGIQESINNKIKYHLVLNPDIIIEPGILDKLLEYLEENNDIGLIMPKIKYPNGQIQYLCKLIPNPLNLFGRRFNPFTKWMDKKNIKYELRFTDYQHKMEVPILSGCFMFLRTEILEKVGAFDERFFLYFEDVDLCRRIGQIAKTIYYPEVYVYHNYARGSYKLSKLLIYHIVSSIKYFNKWGWIFDKERRKINEITINRLNSNTLNKDYYIKEKLVPLNVQSSNRFIEFID